MTDLVKLNNQNIVCFDVDDTLIIYDKPEHIEDIVTFSCPYTGKTVTAYPHKSHAIFIKQQHARGRFVIVWSNAGADWAETVVRTLGLSDYVHLVMTKPIMVVDDGNTLESIVGAKVYLNKHKYLSDKG